MSVKWRYFLPNRSQELEPTRDLGRPFEDVVGYESDGGLVNLLV